MTSYKRPLLVPAPGNHFVQLYEADQLLFEAVGLYAASGLRRGDAVVIIATEAHRAGFAAAMARLDVDLPRARSSGRLTELDAARTLSLFMEGGRPQWGKFQAAISPVIEKARMFSSSGAVLGYGEMVDLLWQGGNRDGAIAVEEAWNQLGRECAFALFCAYKLDPLDPQLYEGGLQRICAAHSHLIPSADTAGLSEAVDGALHETLGTSLSGMLASMAEGSSCATVMPEAQKRLFWMKEHMPTTSERVLERARRRIAPAGD